METFGFYKNKNNSYYCYYLFIITYNSIYVRFFYSMQL